MRRGLFRSLLIFEFLVALQVVFTFWSQVGGQYHLDLMFWPWKFGLSLAAAFLIVAITANAARTEGGVTKRTALYSGLLILVMAAAGVVTWYYHVNEPADEDQDSQDVPAQISRLSTGR